MEQLFHKEQEQEHIPAYAHNLTVQTKTNVDKLEKLSQLMSLSRQLQSNQ